MKVRKISLKRLSGRSSKIVTIDLRSARYSLLESLGCTEMRKEMKKVGIACRLILWISEHLAKLRSGDFGINLRKTLGAILNWGAPTNVSNVFPHPSKGLVFGFNHPTLGEIIRLIAICVTEYPNRKYLFPVNIAWYEELAPVADRMEAFGLYIMPTITPATRDKIAKIVDEDRMKIVDRLARDFNFDYLAACTTFVENHDIIMIAPSATRQETVFMSYSQYKGGVKIEPQTMTLIAMSLSRARVLDECFFIPVAVIPPRNCSRRLNLFKHYDISTCNWISPSNVKQLCKDKSKCTGQRRFEYYFLLMIADELIDKGASRLVYPS